MSLEDLKTALADYEDILTFEEVGDAVEILTKGFIPKNKWASVNEIVKEFGGKYIPANQSSDGKGRWKVPRQQVAKPQIPVHRGPISEICYHAEQIIELAKQLEKK